MSAVRASMAVGLALAIGLNVPASAADAPRPPNERPQDLSSDEAGLWYASDKAEEDAKRSGDLNPDPALTAYVKSVECKVAPEYCDEVRVYVMDRPFFNAAAAPNGYIEVWTGTLLRARSEAGLAFVLGHETTHYAFNHSLEAKRAFDRRMDVVTVFGVLAAPFAGALVLDIGYLGGVASFEHFSRNEELMADRGGFDRLVAAGYDPNAAATDWQALIDEQQHSEFDKVREQSARAGLFDDHPLEGDRLNILTGLAAGKTGDLGRDRLRDAIRPHLAEFLRQDVRRQDYGETLFLIDELQSDGGDAGLLGFYRGECYRLRRGDGDAAKAIAAYETAVAAPDVPAEAWRELGELYSRQKDPAKAKAAYQAYLDHAPAATDRWMVENAMKTLSPAEGT